MARVYIAQCLCPDRHCILAAAHEAESPAAAEQLTETLRTAITELLTMGTLNPWCGLCGAKAESWHYELGSTAFATMDEAMPTLRQMQAEMLAAQAMFGDIHRTTKPN